MPAPAAPRRSVFLVCASYPPVLGGTEIEAQRVCAMLRERGHDVTVLCVGGPPMPPGNRWKDAYGVPVRLFGSGLPEKWRHYSYGIGTAWTFLRERRNFEIAYFLMGGFQLALALPTARFLRKSIVMKFSGSNTIAPLGNSALGRLELRFLRRWADRVLVLNPAMFEEAEAAGLDRSRLEWMPNPVDTGWFAPATDDRRLELRRARSLDAHSPVVLFVGRLAPEKELPSLIQAFALMQKQCPAAQLVLVGRGPLETELRNLVLGLGLGSSVRFTGAVAPEAVCEWLQASDIFALVSSLEGLPCALIEAMSVGIAPVVSGISANRQLVDDREHGLLVPCRGVEAIADALLRLAGDAELRRSCGAAARRRILESYSNEKVVARYEDLFDRVAGAGEKGLE
jgi:glycosyltransferase involved in cell wall biosynthesis